MFSVGFLEAFVQCATDDVDAELNGISSQFLTRYRLSLLTDVSIGIQSRETISLGAGPGPNLGCTSSAQG